MSLLHNYFKVVERFKVDEEELKKICKAIQEEEDPKFKNPVHTPVGDSIFLALEREFDTDTNTVEFVTLEKDNNGYFVGYWKDGKRVKSWLILEPDAYHTVLNFIRIYKLLESFLNSEGNVY